MHDRAVRRRRAVLVVLVAASLILLTAYYGESQDGRLHSLQRGAFSALSPIQEGASRVLKPFRDLFGWFGDTIDAKDQRDKAVSERDAYRTQLADALNRLRLAEEKAGLNKRDATGGMGQYGPVDARVITRSRSSWYQRLTINKGSDDGVRRGDPVINGAGLIGKVEATTGGEAFVTLITDPEFGTGGITSAGREPGSVQVAVGAPGDLLFEPIDADARVREKELIYTAGTTSSRDGLESRYPAAIPIGVVTRIDLGDGDLDRRIHVRPAADLKRTDLVQVLTEPHADLDENAP
jgi:rod shape-determining protein MreC